MEIFAETIERELPDLAEQGVRVRFIGRRDRAPETLRARMDAMEDRTALNTRINLWVAFDYGGRAELVEAARRLVESGVEPADIDENVFAANLYAPELPDPDLLIRTSGELRISNFLLWQVAYSELVFVDKLWPDFDERDLRAALAEYASRRRRFGGAVSGLTGSPISNWVSRLVVAIIGVPVVLGVVYLGGWWVFALAADRGADRAARVLAARAPARAARAGGLRRGGARARRRGGGRHRLGGRRAVHDVRARVRAEGDLRGARRGDDRDQRHRDGRGLDRRRPRLPDPAARAARSTAGWPRSRSCSRSGRATRSPTLGGRLFGRHKMAPATSPGKTWEGFVVGSAATIFVAFVALYHQHFLTIGQSVALGVVRRGRRAARRPLRVAAQARHGGQGHRHAPRWPRRHARPDRRPALRSAGRVLRDPGRVLRP